MMCSSSSSGSFCSIRRERVLVLEQRDEVPVEASEDAHARLVAQQHRRLLVGEPDGLIRRRRQFDRGVELDVEPIREHLELQLAHSREHR